MADFGLTIKVTDGTNDGPAIQGAECSGTLMPQSTDVNGNAVIDGLLLTVEAAGYASYVAQPYHRPSLQAPVTVSLQKLPPVPPLPPVPSRDTVCAVDLYFQGRTVDTEQFGALPWFEAALTSLNDSDRAYVLRQKKDGDKHCIVALTWNYDEPGQPYGNMNQVPGRDMSGDLAAYAAIVREVIVAGFTPIMMLGGDGQGAGPGYNNAVGWTYGYDWLYARLPSIVAALGELAQYCLFCPGWDGVFYGWSVDQLASFGRLFRSLLPVGHLAIEHDTGHIPCGGAGADYAPGGAMSAYDVILSEYDANIHQDSCWQVNARLEKPYVRPADQPKGDDPTPPFYLAAGTARGPYYHCAFEWCEYDWVRGRISAADVEAGRQYMLAMGCKWTG